MKIDEVKSIMVELDKLTVKQAVAYLRHGAEMEELIYSVIARGHFDKICKCSLCALERMARELLTKLEADNGK